MPIVILEFIARCGIFLVEFVQKNWTGGEKKIVIKNKYDTPCTVDCEKRGIQNYEE